MTTRREFLIANTMLAATSLAPRWAHAAATDYATIDPPAATLDPKRIEVLEFFWYGCPHCFNLEGDLAGWKKTLPKDAYFRRMPAAGPASWVPLAKAYFAAEALGVTEKLHVDMFNAIHLSGMNLNERETLLKFVEQYGVNRKQFVQAYDSPAVQAKVAQSQALGQKTGVDSVPTLIIDGRFRTSPSMVGGGHDKLFAIVNELISSARKNKK
jgi:protein dithiol oxidoreductase (disulfide-forming)